MNKAPLPPRKGLQQDACKIVDSLGGATLTDATTYLPTIQERKHTKKQIKTALNNAVYRGFLMRDESGPVTKLRRAPLEYYEARKKVAKAQQRKLRRKAKKPAAPRSVKRKTPKPQPKPSLPTNARLSHMVDRETAITWAVVSLVGGFGIGLALGSLL